MEDYWDDAEEWERDQLAQDNEHLDDWKVDRDHAYIRELDAFEAMDPALAVMAEAQIGFSSDVYLYT